MLYYREALQLQCQDSQSRIADVNAGLTGGSSARQRLATLGRVAGK
ncbi:TPA: hypothetical protein ACGT6A_000807 [Salmonella enterica]|nr:hypothetical protein [Citrobacter braakii]QXC18214.1 hypothetical protein I6L51_09180 [Citrobacter braakii]